MAPRVRRVLQVPYISSISLTAPGLCGGAEGPGVRWFGGMEPQQPLPGPAVEPRCPPGAVPGRRFPRSGLSGSLQGAPLSQPSLPAPAGCWRPLRDGF